MFVGLICLSIFDHNTESKIKYYDVSGFRLKSKRNLSRFTPVSGATCQVQIPA